MLTLAFLPNHGNHQGLHTHFRSNTHESVWVAVAKLQAFSLSDESTVFFLAHRMTYFKVPARFLQDVTLTYVSKMFSTSFGTLGSWNRLKPGTIWNRGNVIRSLGLATLDSLEHLEARNFGVFAKGCLTKSWNLTQEVWKAAIIREQCGTLGICGSGGLELSVGSRSFFCFMAANNSQTKMVSMFKKLHERAAISWKNCWFMYSLVKKCQQYIRTTNPTSSLLHTHIL